MYDRKEHGIRFGAFVLALISGAAILGSCHLHKTEKEGIINHSNIYIEEVDTTDIPDNTVTESDNVTTEYVCEDDFQYEKSVYEMISDKGYELDDFTDFEHEQLEMYSYEQCNSNLAVTTTAVNFRLGPTTEDEIIEELKANTAVDPIAIADNGWYLVQRNGDLGFIKGDYIRVIDDKAIVEQLNDLPEIIPVVQATTNVNIRPEPNTSNTELGTLTAGKSLPMVYRLENGWYEVIYNGEPAYVHGDYVREAFTINAPVEKMIAMREDTTITDVPDGMDMGKITQFEVAKVFKEVEDYYYIEANGQIGFVPKSSCVSLNGTYVVVDISDQTAALYKGTDAIFTSNVVTGSDSTPSDLGIFDIDSMSKDATLTGPGYSVGVKYWMPYNGGEGLHDASWRGSFGGDIYHNSGSHGCINMPTSAAETIYDTVHTGDTVVVKR